MIYIIALQLIDPNKSKIPQTNDNAIQTLLTDFFVLLGAIAFLIILVAGARYIFAHGNAETVKSARNTIFYAVLGLVIAALAASLVNIVLGRAG